MTTNTAGKRVTVDLTPQQHAALLEVARELSCTAARGLTTDQPSIEALMAAIADGEVYARRYKAAPPREKSASAKVRAILAERPAATSAEVAREAKCSISLVSKIRQGVNPAPVSRTRREDSRGGVNDNAE